MQSQVNKIVGSSTAQERSGKSTKSAGYSLQFQAEVKGVSAGGGGGESKSQQFEEDIAQSRNGFDFAQKNVENSTKISKTSKFIGVYRKKQCFIQNA